MHGQTGTHSGKTFRWEVVEINIALAYVDYYIGAYGNTVRIATKSKDWVISFREKIEDVFNGNIQNIDICQMPHIKCFDSIGSLELIKVKKCYTPCVVLKCIDGKYVFKWAQDAEEIETLLGLIDGLIVDDSPCHQYLAYEDDGCVIELSYNEE